MNRQKKMRRRKCKHCKELYKPDYRNRTRQEYCSKPECRKASKRASQQKWLSSEKGKDYFKGPTNVERVQQWRKAHPEYSKSPRRTNSAALQDTCISQAVDNELVEPILSNLALQDAYIVQPAVVVGLISSLIGSTLQDDIAKTLFKFVELGSDIQGTGPGISPKGGRCERETSNKFRKTPQGAAPV